MDDLGHRPGSNPAFTFEPGRRGNNASRPHNVSQSAPQTATGTVLRTPAGNVRPLAEAPPLPAMAPSTAHQQPATSYLNGYPGYRNGLGGVFGGGTPYGGYGGYGSGAYGSYGGAYGGGYGPGYFGSAGGGYGYRGYPGSFMGAGIPNSSALEPEARFIQMAEESTKSAFQSIESLVMTIGNIAAMLDSTFFALTSSFRAVLGVAANFGRLRGVFAQFWHNLFLFRGIIWLYRKLLYWLRLSKWDPSSMAFKKAFADAFNEANAQMQGAPTILAKVGGDTNRPSPWPVVLFMSFIVTAPYLIMKLLGNMTTTAQEEARNPRKWVHPVETVALYDFQARNQSELSLYPGQRVLIAPREIQQTLRLLNTGWAMAAVDGHHPGPAPDQSTPFVGLIPINYVKSPQQMHEERVQELQRDHHHHHRHHQEQQQQHQQRMHQHSAVNEQESNSNEN